LRLPIDEVLVVDGVVAGQRRPERHHVGGNQGVDRELDRLDRGRVGDEAEVAGGNRDLLSEGDVVGGEAADGVDQCAALLITYDRICLIDRT
jgi:hypothetical protein